jgi:hypothetical protein
MKREQKIATESKGQRAKESVQCSKFKVHSSRSLLLLTSCPSGRRVVNGSEKTSLNPGLQHHSMWLKPDSVSNISIRQLKQTAIIAYRYNLTVSQFHNLYDMRLAVRNRLALNKRNSTVFYIKPSANGIYFPAEGCISESRAVRACLLIRVFNN